MRLKKLKIIENARYALVYDKDVTVPPRADPRNTEVAHFRSVLGFTFFLVWNEAARAAIRSRRFQFITIQPKKAA